MNDAKINFIKSTIKENFISMIEGLNLKPPVIIKPNWGYSLVFTEATILDWVLSAIDDEVLIVESYGWARCEKAIKEKKNTSMERDVLKQNDQWFLEYSGIDQILKKHNVEYLNITEEVWAKRTVDQNQIKTQVEDVYPEVYNKEMYSYIPTQLYELQDGTFLSLAKLKLMGPDPVLSLSIKNLFGMIPGPDRGKFHGENNRLMNQSILDIFKVYQAIFDIKGVVEAVFTASQGMSLDPEIYTNLGYAWFGNNLLNLDTVVSAHVGINPNNVKHFQLAAECIGEWDKVRVANAEKDIISLK